MKQGVYISGKITGLPMQEVTDKFIKAEQYLYKAGFREIINPVFLDHSANKTEDHDQYMKTDIKSMMDCNTIYVLPCWKDSKGAKIELQLAIQLNFNIIWGD
ncbi:DUF4406 domain-containing protein [Mucilaginibacter lappiensis]|uniref:DUF4406 domain-containing protein n=1 Tax=Mucilaginibacter lappiensis TaxID=354630 RepID=A0A841JLL8_9SPHI|nr:DUF4406 domain-containing protein [Mucilaginibacter lappiensis]MBB6131354.1 hypothetical protein [Mucilaginibacter lappiensis]